MADIGFLLDMSSSIGGPRYFRFETDFVKDVLDNFSSEKNQIRAAVILYGKEAQLKIKLNDFTRLDSFKKALDERVKFKGAPLTRIDRALDLANKELFTEANGDRPRIPNYLVLVTDGRQNSGDYYTDLNLVPGFARPLWERNVTIFAVGVGRASREQLKRIAGKDGTAIYKKRLHNLKDAVDVIIPSQCKGKWKLDDWNRVLCNRNVWFFFVLSYRGLAWFCVLVWWFIRSFDSWTYIKIIISNYQIQSFMQGLFVYC